MFLNILKISAANVLKKFSIITLDSDAFMSVSSEFQSIPPPYEKDPLKYSVSGAWSTTRIHSVLFSSVF